MRRGRSMLRLKNRATRQIVSNGNAPTQRRLCVFRPMRCKSVQKKIARLKINNLRKKNCTPTDGERVQYKAKLHDMNTNFQTFKTDDVQTKTVNGLTLVFDPDLNKFVLPVETKSGKRILYDDATNQFIEVLIANGGFMYHERTASGDGIDLTERVFVSANGSNPKLAIDAITPESIASEKLKFQKQIIDAANGVVPFLYIGTAISVVVFFWQLIAQLDVIVAAITVGSTAAMTEIGYLFVWAIGGILLLFVLFRGVPLLFRAGATTNESPGSEFYTGDETNGEAGGDATVTNIFINNAKNVNGGVGNAGAQDFINNRKM
jgi:hypothetical protein